MRWYEIVEICALIWMAASQLHITQEINELRGYHQFLLERIDRLIGEAAQANWNLRKEIERQFERRKDVDAFPL